MMLFFALFACTYHILRIYTCTNDVQMAKFVVGRMRVNPIVIVGTAGTAFLTSLEVRRNFDVLLVYYYCFCYAAKG